VRTLSFLALCLSVPPLLAVPLVRDGKARAVLAIPSDADVHEAQAAKDLADHVARMSGAKLEVKKVVTDGVAGFLAQAKKDGLTPVLIGRTGQAHVEKELKSRGTVAGTFALRVTKDHVVIAGLAEGPYYGAMELLEQLGVRWFMPGDLGTVIPEMKTIDVREQETLQVPSFPARWFQMPDRDWQKRMRCGGPTFPSAHGLPGVPKFAANPELYALVNGKRVARQHCISNPKVLDAVVKEIIARRKRGLGPVIGIGANDGRGFCECENCRKLDGGDIDPFAHEPSMTDRYIWFFNQVLEKLGPEHKDVKLAFYIYAAYMRPPVKWKPDVRITGALAPIALDRVHGFSNPAGPEKSYARWLFQEWGKLIPEVWDRGYWSNLADPGFPFIIVHRLRDEIPTCHTLGVKGFRVETFPNYGPMLPSNYIAARLMWDHKADVDALLRDFYEKFFGPAAGPMGKYISLMDAALRDSPCCTGSAWDMPHHYPPAVRKQARALLAEGAKLAAGEGVYEKRVKMIADTFEMLEAFIAMLDTRTKGDFVAAQKELTRLDEVAGRLMAMKPVPMVSSGRFSSYVSYMRRFYRPATEQAYKRVTGGNKPIAVAKDEWEFLIDPPRVGEAIGLWRPGVKGGNWQTIKTSSSSWSNQGLRYYKGLAWYRQTLDVPKEFVDRRVFLWCGGVDEKAKVWVNGKPIGVSHGGAFSPFEMDATGALKAGKNEVVFVVINEVLNELGTGGIVAPVMLYAPAAGKDAKLENIRPLGETFP
jgi:hypothetical protein